MAINDAGLGLRMLEFMLHRYFHRNRLVDGGVIDALTGRNWIEYETPTGWVLTAAGRDRLEKIGLDIHKE